LRYDIQMEPRIQYATTSDGISIACWSIGEGPPLVNPPPALPWSHIELEWQIPEWRHWYEHLLETYRIVRYDNRGSGLSTRGITGSSLETHIRDLEAVVDRLGLERFAIFGMYFNAPIAIAYAVRHPERVSHLILFCGLANVDEAQRSAGTLEALERLREIDYELFTETLAHTVFGWSEGDAAHRRRTPRDASTRTSPSHSRTTDRRSPSASARSCSQTWRAPRRRRSGSETPRRSP
jgi:pimeloyl-ACP methyl ester carboxylesterase